MLIPTEDAPHLRTWLLQKLPELFVSLRTDCPSAVLITIFSEMQYDRDGYGYSRRLSACAPFDPAKCYER